ncbi:hypothetical protein LC048_00555 [Mesobacillus subterraneus]|uniref:hypothetical protein n=1 Tax=Mesobacillus subterraneus TaxID=285983 RepID=UPI00273D02C1|nr:hypothetical protein [Mesobacillus subterraneus]WLR55548.1 hypothetical protein LC048_00555 [Mesobacillus subterraneus]
MRGVVEEEVEQSALKFALPSQDLYYEYLILKDIIESGVKIKYYILGLAYYSFDWDLSLTRQEVSRIKNVYYPIFKDSHNSELEKNEFYYFQGIHSIKDRMDPLIFEIFGRDVFEIYLEEYIGVNLTPDFNDEFWNTGTYLKEHMGDIDERNRDLLGKQRADFHNKLNYPLSRIENKNILRRILKILEEHNIKIILTVFPTTKYYSENFNKDTKKRFYDIINEFSKEFSIQVIDVFDSEEFEISDFVDWDHLNKIGAAKMTKKLNELVNW